MMHIGVSKINIIGSDNGVSPGRRRGLIRTDDGMLLIWPLGNGSHFVSALKCYPTEVATYTETDISF